MYLCFILHLFESITFHSDVSFFSPATFPFSLRLGFLFSNREVEVLFNHNKVKITISIAVTHVRTLQDMLKTLYRSYGSGQHSPKLRDFFLKSFQIPWYFHIHNCVTSVSDSSTYIPTFLTFMWMGLEFCENLLGYLKILFETFQDIWTCF